MVHWPKVLQMIRLPTFGIGRPTVLSLCVGYSFHSDENKFWALLTSGALINNIGSLLFLSAWIYILWVSIRNTFFNSIARRERVGLGLKVSLVGYVTWTLSTDSYVLALDWIHFHGSRWYPTKFMLDQPGNSACVEIYLNQFLDCCSNQK